MAFLDGPMSVQPALSGRPRSPPNAARMTSQVWSGSRPSIPPPQRSCRRRSSLTTRRQRRCVAVSAACLPTAIDSSCHGKSDGPVAMATDARLLIILDVLSSQTSCSLPRQNTIFRGNGHFQTSLRNLGVRKKWAHNTSLKSNMKTFSLSI